MHLINAQPIATDIDGQIWRRFFSVLLDNSKWADESKHGEVVTSTFSKLEGLREKMDQEPTESIRPLLNHYEQSKDDSLGQLIVMRNNANGRSKVLGRMQSMLQSAITTTATRHERIKHESERHDAELNIARSAHDLYLTMATPPSEVVQASTTYISSAKAQSSRLQAKCLRHQKAIAALQRTLSACSEHKGHADAVLRLIHQGCKQLSAAEEWETAHRELLESHEREAARKLEEERNRATEKQKRKRKLQFDQLTITP